MDKSIPAARLTTAHEVRRGLRWVRVIRIERSRHSVTVTFDDQARLTIDRSTQVTARKTG
ncbi:hypothetical protein ACFV3R_25615 [Streptomyces sp. NPDC059740]|uniref:hypothetical protein n=1 Tax=Streptomyces sp. NPDC059740 TaxID=3346926 RepID=UPI003657169B